MSSNNGALRQSGRVVVVTGGTAGVGRATVRAFASNGDDVAILARGEDGLAAACREVEAMGQRALGVSTDVADYEQVASAARRIEEELGEIDVWVNGAMTTVFAPLKEITPEEYRRATEVTYLGTVHGTMVALERFLPRNEGALVQVGSALAYRAIPLQAPYCGAKHAIRAMTDSLRSELLHDGSNVYVTMVQLPGLNTPQFNWCKTKLPNHPQPVPPIYQPEVAAEAIVWASKNRRREVTVGLPSLKTIWGQKVAPGFLDHYLANNAYSGQQTDEPVSPDRPSNLFEPVPGDHGAHGNFDSRARGMSPQLEANKHKRMAMAGAGILAAGVMAGILARR